MANLGLDPDFVRRLAQLSLVSRRILSGRMRGERRSKKRGISIEFADYRDYAPGDDLRFLDWNIYGRLDRLFLKLFIEEEDLFLYLLIDKSLSMAYGNPRKIDAAARAAAALGYIALCDLDRVSVSAFSGGEEVSLRPQRGRAATWRLFDFLENVEPEGETDTHAAARRFLLRNKRRGIVVYLSDLLDPAGYEEALKAIAASGMDLYVIHMLAEEEVDPDLAGDYKLVDVETAEPVEVTASAPMRRSYRRVLEGFCATAKAFCARRAVGYTFTTTAVPFDELVLRYLRSAGLVR